MIPIGMPGFVGGYSDSSGAQAASGGVTVFDHASHTTTVLDRASHTITVFDSTSQTVSVFDEDGGE